MMGRRCDGRIAVDGAASGDRPPTEVSLVCASLSPFQTNVMHSEFSLMLYAP